MRIAFVKALIDARRRNEKIHLLTGDLGFQVFEEFVQKYPESFTNVGVAEANMIGIAAGMAHLGLEPICYSIAPFLIFRALEQIRDDICYHRLNVKIVGVGGGLGYSTNGQSHTTIEDIVVARSLPNMSVVCPGDPLETYMATKQIIERNEPAYLRLGKRGETNLLYEHIGNFEIGKPVEIRKGGEIVIFSVGNMLEETINLADELAKLNIDVSHIHVHTIKPVVKSDFVEILKRHRQVVTIEEHSVIGGLGSLISEINSTELENPKRLLMLGIEDKYFSVCGTQKYLREQAGLDRNTLLQKISSFVKTIQKSTQANGVNK